MTEAYKHVSRFSRLLRAYVKSSRNKYISIQDEVVNLKNYIELQQTRFKDKFSYNISIDEAIPPESSLIPSLLLQPFVENAISHGLLNKHGKGHLEISFKRNSFSHLTCIIEDDGIGRLAANALEKDELSKESYGNELIDDLISVFRKYEDMRIEIKYQDKAHPLSGTIVVITIKK
jgi:LytS/YehU family sensor histidine kinase